MPTNIIESSQELSDKDFFCLIIILLQSLVICNYNLVTSTWVCSIWILSSVGGYHPAPLGALVILKRPHFVTPVHKFCYFMTRCNGSIIDDHISANHSWHCLNKKTLYPDILFILKIRRSWYSKGIAILVRRLTYTELGPSLRLVGDVTVDRTMHYGN